jgi:spore coat protein U-like protein
MRAAVKVLVAAALVLAPSVAHATSSCRLMSVTPVGFGAYDPFAQWPTDSVGSVTILCSGITATPPIVLQLGRGRSSSFFPRSMSGGAYSLNYNLFIDAGRLGVWGDGSGGTATVTVAAPEGQPVTTQVYGRIYALQSVAAGTYADSVLVTVQF